MSLISKRHAHSMSDVQRVRTKTFAAREKFLNGLTACYSIFELWVCDVMISNLRVFPTVWIFLTALSVWECFKSCFTRQLNPRVTLTNFQEYFRTHITRQVCKCKLSGQKWLKNQGTVSWTLHTCWSMLYVTCKKYLKNNTPYIKRSLLNIYLSNHYYT